jgi:endonuclease-3
MTPEQCYTIFDRMQTHNPHPTTELHYHSPFELLIAVMLSAQATDTSVNQATAQLFQVANTATAILELGEEKLKNYIKTIGLFNTKARHIIKTCQILVEQFHGEVPNNRKDLERLPGVGRKTANVILNVIFGEATIAVDTHIFRVANRTGLAPGKTVREVEENLLKCLPEPYRHDAPHWLVLHGRYTCLARQPKCEPCLIADLCDYPHKVNLRRDALV